MKLPIKIYRLILFIILYSLFFIQFSSPMFAQAKTPQPTPLANPVSSTNPDVPNNLHNWTQSVMIEVMSSLTCQLAGVDPINPNQNCLGVDQKTGKIGFVPNGGGAIAVMGNMISTLYTPPIHTSDYFRDLASNFGITKRTYAQQAGTGFQGLTPLIGIWSAFRNIVYLVLVIIFVVIGLTVMFRIKIDPRTVMSIQNQIPKIIIGIVVVTFSFAIAGFLIDLMWVFIYLIFGIISTIPGVSDVQNFNPAVMQGKNALGAVGTLDVFKITSDASGGIKDLLKNFLGTDCKGFLGCLNTTFNPLSFALNPKDLTVMNILFNLISTIAGGAMFFKILGIGAPNLAEGLPGFSALFQLAAESTKLGIATAAGTGVYASTQILLREFLPWFIAYLIIFIALLAALFRLWFTLIKAYVSILLDVVLAPFWIIGGIVPGSPISITGWLKDISANLLAFPVTIAMFMLGKVFMDAFGKSPATGANFVPPLIGNPGNPSLIGSLIGLGIILMTPNVVTMLKAAIKAPKIEGAGGVGKAIGVGTGVLTAPVKPVIGGFSFLAGSAAAKKIPILGNLISKENPGAPNN